MWKRNITYSLECFYIPYVCNLNKYSNMVINNSYEWG